jgi:hypothetical protein
MSLPTFILESAIIRIPHTNVIINAQKAKMLLIIEQYSYLLKTVSKPIITEIIIIIPDESDAYV